MSRDFRIRVYIVDDHQVVRVGLKTMLESEPDIEVVGMASCANDALEAMAHVNVDVLLTDLRLGGTTGDVMLQELRELNPQIRATVLTNYHSDEEVFNSIKAGAAAYILKSATMEEIVSTIRAVHSGKTVIPPHIAEQLAACVGRSKPSVRETEILKLVALGMSNSEIGDKLFISKNTVRNHVINLLEKLGTRDRTEAAAVAIKRGLVRVHED